MTKRALTWHYYGITSACENPEAAIKWIDYVYASEDGRMLYSYGIEGLSYEKDENGNITFTDLITNNETYKCSGREEALEHIELLEPENFGSLDSYLKTFEIKTGQLMERCACRENPMYAVQNQIIRQYVEEHLTDANLSLGETARVMRYTSTYFGKYFKEQFGCAFQQYVAVRRIECAKKYLLEDGERRNKSIQEIALACGFTNDVTFRRTFKRYTGVTPSQFGKEINI